MLTIFLFRFEQKQSSCLQLQTCVNAMKVCKVRRVTMSNFIKPNQEIELKGVCTGDQVADIFTKALAKFKFESFRAILGIVDREHALRGVLQISA